MSKINLLDKSVYNRIAAGEVVERPFSVVKELIENSIDAGATQITVRLEDGGKRSISVKDDGCGIEKDDLIKALMPHATSKIRTADDLDKILTLGFRGEALASIAAVSDMTLISKVKESEMGYTVKCECGETGDVEPYPSEDGTCIVVENLFRNTPARAKFLKQAKSEDADISNIVTRLIFAHPEISFKLFIDDKETLRSGGESLDQAIIEIYGYDAISDCTQIDTVKNGLHISGFIGKTYFVKPNRTYQTVILNGRYIVNTTIQSAIHNAYAEYLMKRKYPFYVLNVEIDPEFVDVNVHPNKTDVRFVDNQVVYSTIYSVISKVLDGSAAALDIIKPNCYFQIDPGARPVEKPKEIDTSEVPIVDSDKPIATRFETRDDLYNPASWGLKYDFDRNIEVSDSAAVKDEPKKSSIDDIFAENKRYIEELEQKNRQKEEIKQAEFVVEERFKVIGQVLTTYLILEKGDSIYMIDQHAAHERLLFDKLIDDYKKDNLDVQSLLVPYELHVNEKEAEFITERFSDFRKMGIDINEYSDCVFSVYALPLNILDMDVKAFFDDVLSDMSLRRTDVPDVIRDKLAQKACKAAIKSGKTLSGSEIDKLLEMLNGDMGLKCPHGRPIAIRITRAEIDKWFKRIV